MKSNHYSLSRICKSHRVITDFILCIFNSKAAESNKKYLHLFHANLQLEVCYRMRRPPYESLLTSKILKTNLSKRCNFTLLFVAVEIFWIFLQWFDRFKTKDISFKNRVSGLKHIIYNFTNFIQDQFTQTYQTV